MSQGRQEREDLSPFCCQNEDCPDYGQRGQSNLTVCMRYGKQQRRLVYCMSCKARFSERKATPLFDARLSEEKVAAVLAHIAEGVGVRKTGRLVGVSKDTVVRYCLRADEHAQQLHEELVAFSPEDPRGPVRRKVVLRRPKGKALRPRRSGR